MPLNLYTNTFLVLQNYSNVTEERVVTTDFVDVGIEGSVTGDLPSLALCERFMNNEATNERTKENIIYISREMQRKHVLYVFVIFVLPIL